MSGSRAIVLSLSVRDADVVRQQLVQMGEQGERALQRLDAAAQRSSGNAGVPALSRATREASDNTGRLGQVMGQAGFQIQDFASQVSAGQSALVALSQQGSQLLGVFGTGGAIAGAVLTVGILAYQLLSAGDATKELEQAQERLAQQMRQTNEFLETAAERAARLAREQRAAAAIGPLSERINVERQLNDERRALELLRRQREELIQSNSQLPGFNPTNVLREPIEQRIAEIERLEGILSTLRGQQQTVLTGPSGEQRDQAETLRRQLDERYRIAQQYDERIRELRGLAAVGLFGPDELERLEGQAATERDEQFARLGPRPSRPERAERPGLDVTASVQQSIDDLTRSYDAYNQALNLSNAGLEAAAPALAEYARHQQLLTALLDANIITEEQFGAEVERTSERLREQIEETQRRTERTGQFANQLGFSFSSAFEDAILKGKSLSDVLKGLQEDIARVIIQSAITAPLRNAIGSGVQSLMGSISFGGQRAEGGPVSGGMAYLVGERGPEIVVPRNSGTVIPNDRIGGPSISQTFNIDARGADASMVPRLRAEMVAIARASNAELLDSIQRGGSAARIVGRRA